MTVWPARRVGDRILCGRQVDGRYVCQGELAPVDKLIVGSDAQVAQEVITLPPGYVMDPPGSHHWRPTARAERQRTEGRQPLGANRGPEAGRIGSAPDIPRVMRGFPGPDWTRDCPHCGTVARVTYDLLSYSQTKMPGSTRKARNTAR